MAEGTWSLFKVIIIVQLFYAFAITILAYSMPVDTLNHVDAFSDLAGEINLSQVSSDIQGTVENQLNVPIIELGALVFYSGNIVIDLMLNFFFAIPQMMGLLINGFMMLVGIDSYLFAQVEIFLSILIVVLYFVGLIELLMNIRGRGSLT